MQARYLNQIAGLHIFSSDCKASVIIAHKLSGTVEFHFHPVG